MRLLVWVVCLASLCAADSAARKAYDEWRRDYLTERAGEDLEKYVVILEEEDEIEVAFGRGFRSNIEVMQIKNETDEESVHGTKGNRKGHKVKWPSSFGYWPETQGYPIVSYRIGSRDVEPRSVQAGIQHWEQHTCLRFHDVGGGTLTPHVVFMGSDSGCYSLVGRLPLPLVGQPIGLTRACQLKMGVVVHEIGHAIGFQHEQSRSDRDKYVTLNRDNLAFFLSGNTKRMITENYGTPYDFYSVMHYGMIGFSTNGNSTLVTKDPMMQGLMGHNRDELSHMDKRTANLFYECIDKWLAKCSLSRDPCKNFGYTGEDCKCVCPEGTSGDKCQNKAMEYSEALAAKYLPHNSVVTEEGNITSPGFPTPMTHGVRYTTRIIAPACHTVQLTFSVFETRPRCATANTKGRCCMDGLELRIRGEDVTSGRWFCGTEIKPGQEFTSQGQEIVLYYMGFNYASLYAASIFRGYHATVKFKKKINC